MQGDWNEWGRHVLAELKRQGSELDGLRKQNITIIDRMGKIEGKLTILKIKMSGLGAILGAGAIQLLKSLHG